MAALLEIAKLITRFKLNEVYKDEIEACSCQLDRTLVPACSAMKSKGCSPSHNFKSECELVMPVTAADRLLKVTGSLVGSEDDINVVVSSSALGKKLF